MSTLKIISPTWSNFSIPGMKNLMKQLGKAQSLGIQISPTLGISFLSSNLVTSILGNVKGEKNLTLELCNVDPLLNSIMNFNPHLGLCIKSFVMDFDCKISNLNFPWINPHNFHHTKTKQTQYQKPYKWILFYVWMVKPIDNLMLKQFLGGKIMPTVTGI